jgi:hypothetical protein
VGAVTVTSAVQRIGNLSPFVRSANLQASGAFVCSPASEVPDPLRVAHEERHAFYMSHSGPDARTAPPHAPAYYVTSYGVLIAWVTLDGQTHYADDVVNDGRKTTRLRHQAAVRAVWPERFIFDGEARVRGVIDPAPVIGRKWPHAPAVTYTGA